MAGKRGTKRKTAEDSKRSRGRPKKRAKGTHTDRDVDYQKEYRVRSIIGESKTKYHIDWEPDSDTGETYEPTWEPKANANQLAINDWESRQAARSNPHPESVASHTEEAPSVPIKRGRGRPRKVVKSSSLATSGSATVSEQPPAKAPTAHVTTKEADSLPIVSEVEPEIGESQQSQGDERSIESPLFAANRQLSPRKGFVVPSSPPSSYITGTYLNLGSQTASKDGAALSQAITSVTGAPPVVSSPQVVSSTAKGFEPEQVPSASASGDSTQKSTNNISLVIPESQSQEAPEEESFRGFSPTQRADPSPDTQPSVGALFQGGSNQLAAGYNQLLDTSHPPVEKPSSHRVRQTSQSPLPPEAPCSGDQVIYSASVLPQTSRIDPGTQRLDETSAVLSGATSNTIPEQAQCVPNTVSILHDSGDRQIIVISSTENQSGQSTSLDPESSVHEADYEPPPPGQRPRPSSAIGDDHEELVRPSQVTTVGPSTQQEPTSQAETQEENTSSQEQSRPQTIHNDGLSQASFPFQTQLPRPYTPSHESLADFAYTPGSRALFISTESPAPLPDTLSSRPPDSTPFPSVPSYSLAVGESAPQPISLSSSELQSTMDSSVEKRATLAEKMKRLRDERSAKRSPATPVPSVASSFVNGHVGNGQPASALPLSLIAEVTGAQAARLGSPMMSHERSPSTVPAVEAVAPITREEMITSGRYETLLPQAHTGRMGEAEAHQKGAAIGTSPPQVTSEDPELANVHAVPVASSAQQRDQYQNHIYFERALVEEVSASRNMQEDLLARASRFLRVLRDIAMHPDLISPETTSQVAASDIQARWDIKCSAKFCFLNELISNLAGQNLHIAIAAQGKRLPDMLHKFLEGIKVPFKRWAQPLSIDQDLSSANPGLKVSIVDLDGGPQNIEPADVVVSMDPRADSRHPFIRAARKKAVAGGIEWAMLLTLVVPRTIEHVESCLQADMSPATRVKVLVKAMKELQREAGRLESTQAPLVEAAARIADYLDDTSADWPIAGLSQLEELDSQTETDLQPDSHGAKRPLEENDADESTSTKRARHSPALTMEPQPAVTINPLDLDVAQLGDSLAEDTPSKVEGISFGQSATANEQRLREALSAIQDRHDEHVRALEALQYRYEDLRTKLYDVENERDAAVQTAQTAVTRMQGAEANNAALRTERAQLKDTLADANRRLLGHAVPEVRELQEVRVQLEQAEVEREKAVKKASATETTLEWTRSRYQDSSDRARALAQSNTELETRLAHATHLARGEQARAREISYQAHNKQLEQENKKLKQTLASLKLAMRSKDEQITSLRDGRGRMGTRQSSVPRSPRMGSPMKGGRLSRQTSPAASDARGRAGHLHPLRNSAGG